MRASRCVLEHTAIVFIVVIDHEHYLPLKHIIVEQTD